MIVFKKSTRFAISAFKLVSAVMGLVVLVVHTPAAFADTNTNYNITYVAPWASGATVDPNNHNVNVCLKQSIGDAEACIAQYASTYHHGATLGNSGWVASDPSTCPQVNLQPTECLFGQFVNNNFADNPGFFLGQFCDFGGNYVAPVGLSYPGYCLMQGLINKNTGCPDCKGSTTKDPVDMTSGNVFESVTDYRGGGAFPLIFSRSYNSGLSASSTENIGFGWNTGIGAHLSIQSRGQLVYCPEPVGYPYVYLCPGTGFDVTTTPIEVTVWGADGSQPTYTYPYNTAPDGTQLQTEQTSMGQLFFVGSLPAPATGNGFRFLRTDGYTEYFTSTGVLVAVQNPVGLIQTYQYTSGQLTRLTDPFGRHLDFTYDGNGRVQAVATPTGMLTYSYDTNGNLSSVNYPDLSNPNGVTVTYKYENTTFIHALTGVVDENGNRYATWGYDTSGRANSSQNAGGVDSYSAIYTANNAGNITSVSVTDPTGLARNLTFTNINFLTLLTNVSAACTECSDKTHAYTYDANGFIASKTDFDGNVTQYVHDAFGNETSRTEAYGTPDARTITTQWNLGVNQPALITEPGRTTGYSYDGVGHVLTKTLTDTVTHVARTTTYAYYSSGAAAGLLETVTDPLNHVTSYAYDAQGDLASVTNAKGQETQITSYDANGMPLTIIDPNGVETDLTYDARQRLLTRTVAGAETQFTYDAVGNLTQVTLPTGSFLKYTYDAAHRLTGITDSVGDSIAYTLDNVGNRTGENTYDPANTLKKTLQRTYNTLNQLLTVVGGASQTTTYTDDTNGNVTSIQDPLGNPATTQLFDSLNRLIRVVDPESGNTHYNYDALDRVQDVTDPKGLNTHYNYDAFGDVTQQQSPDTGTTAYTYDLDGNRLTKTDARGITATYSYDALNRLTSITYPDASRNVSYTYDQGAYGIGHLTGMSDSTGTTAYTYDAHGNTTQKAVTLGTHTFTVGYQYDTADNLTGMTYPSGLHVSYVRDTAERVTEVDANSSPIVSGISYEPFGPITGFTYGNGLTETRSYDQDYRLTGITVPGVLNWTFSDDADDNILGITDNLNGSNSQTLGYDTLNRLTSATGSYGSQGYAYSGLDGLDGNRTQATLGGVPTTLTYDTASNKLLTVGSTSRQYDAVGNLINDGTHSYSYDATNRLTGYDSTQTAYLYNGLGQRSVKAPADTGIPSVAIIAPSGGADLTGTVTISASASDTFEIASVQFQLDDANLGAPITAAPYTTSWNTAMATDGTHTLTAVATDPNGRTATSAGLSVIVDNTPPMVAISSPTSGADVSGTVTVTATANDNVSVASVQFQLDGANLGAAQTAAPYSVSWDTTTATGGSHSLTAIAIDEVGHTTTATTANVTVDNTPPTVSITAPASGADLRGTVAVSASASASFGVGIASIQFQLDGTNLGTAQTAAPYTITWDTTTATGGSHSLKAIATDAAGNSTTSAAITVTVDDTAPSVVVTAPSNGTDLKGTVSVSANAMASYGVGISSVQFQLDGANLGAAQTAAPYTITWDTTTATGGNHTLTAIATDQAGNTATSAGVAVTVDNTPPTVTISSPASGADVGGTVTVSANASASFGVAIASVQFLLDGVNLGTAVTGAPYTTPWNTTTYPGGSHTLTAIATDQAGNTSTSAGVTVTVDNTAPTVSISAPTSGMDVGSTITVSANATDNVSVASVQFKVDGNPVGTATTAPYSASWNTTQYAGGVHTLTATATDGAGNITTSTGVSVTVDNTAPTVSITAPANGAQFRGTVSVSANASDNVGVKNVQFQLDGVNLGSAQTAAPYAISWDTTTAAGGSHTLTAVATDLAGNTTTSAGISVTVDNAPPTVHVTSPANGSYVHQTVNLYANASGNYGVAVTSVQYKLDGANLGAAQTAFPYNLSWDTTTATGGSHALTAIATDALNNTATSSAVTMIVDNTLPTVTITAPTVLNVSGTVTLSATASDNVGVANVQFQLDGVNIGPALTSAPYNYSWDSATSVGNHTLKAVATDLAGNTKSYSESITVNDITPPTVSITSPANGALVPASFTVYVTAADNDTNHTVSLALKVDGTSTGHGFISDGNGNYHTLLQPGPGSGSHTLTVVATDFANNSTTSAPVTITVDTTPPTVSITSPVAGNVSGTVNVTASASDNIAVASVQFQLDGTNLGAAVTGTPYSISWNTTTATPGSHKLTAIATDTAGNTTTSSWVSVTVPDTTPPTVSITAPANGDPVTGTLTVRATASDNVGVSSVQFKLDGTNLGSAVTTSPYSVSWNTSSASLGAHTLTAVAKDAAGNTTTSASVSVTVTTTNLTAPTLSPTSVVINYGSSTNLSWANTSNPGTFFQLYSSGSSGSPSFPSGGVLVYSGTNTNIDVSPGDLTYYRVATCTSTYVCSPWSTVTTVSVNGGR